MPSDLRKRQVDPGPSRRYISPRSKQSKQLTRRNRTGQRGSRKVEPRSQTREGRKATASRSGRPQDRNGGPDRGRTRKGSRVGAPPPDEAARRSPGGGPSGEPQGDPAGSGGPRDGRGGCLEQPEPEGLTVAESFGSRRAGGPSGSLYFRYCRGAMGSRSQRAADAEARRERIVEVAMRHFAEHGYRGARVEDIANEVGVAKGTVFLDFASKEGLFLAAYQRAVSSLPAVAGRARGRGRERLLGHARLVARSGPRSSGGRTGSPTGWP